MRRSLNKHKSNHQKPVNEFRTCMLDWYQEHARVLPWRAKFGEFPDPYHEWLSEIMLQQTVVKAVIKYFDRFITLWPSVNDLAEASQEDVMREWAGLGYYARARNLHKCAKIISDEYDGHFPRSEEELLKLPGIGPYTAAAISSIAYGNPSTVMDGNIERVMVRVFAHKQPIKETKKDVYGYAKYFSDGCIDYPGEYAQALMDLGATICTPMSPKCMLCPISDFCSSYKQGLQDKIPVKKVKQAKPTRYGTVYFIENEKGELLSETRPEKGLFAGMRALPGTSWQEDKQVIANTIKNFQINHTFTHFHLILKGKVLKNKEFDYINKDCFWFDPSDYDKIGLPSLYKKAVKQYINLKG